MTALSMQPRKELPSSWTVGLARGGLEVRQFFRQKDAVAFTFAFPALLLGLLGLIFRAPHPGAPVSMSLVLAASVLAYGIVSTAFTSTGIGVAVDRDNGTLKRLRGTPATAGSYLLGKGVLVLVVTLAEIVLLLGVAVAGFGLALPATVGGWWTFVWVTLLSVTSCTVTGIGASALARSARGAMAVMTVPAIILGFTSGIFVHVLTLPSGMVTVASFFPVKWMGQGFRAVFLPESMAAFEVAGSFELGRVALVLGAWSVIGLLLCLGTFRWHEPHQG